MILAKSVGVGTCKQSLYGIKVFLEFILLSVPFITAYTRDELLALSGLCLQSG